MGLRAPCLTFRVDGRGWVMRECSDEVRLGMMRLWSALSLVGGRSLAPVRGRKLKEGAIAADSTSVLSSWA